MKEITITLHRHWLELGEEKLAERIAKVIFGHANHVALQQSGYKWGLNTPGNDWKMSEIADGKVAVAYRYGTGGNEKMMEALEVFLQWALGPSDG